MRTFLAGLLCFLTLSSAGYAQDKATIPYAKIHAAFQKAAKIQSKDVRFAVAVASKDKAVRPAAITLTIQTKGGARRIKIDPDGELHRFPLNAALLAENPPVVSNQPKGSLQIGGGLIFIAPTAAKYSYQTLCKLLDDGNAELKQHAGFISFIAPQAKALQFEFFGGGKQTLTVGSKTAPQKLTTDALGNISLPIDKALLAENPTVILSKKPSRILPDL